MAPVAWTATMTTTRPAVGQIYALTLAAPWFLREVGARVRLTGVNEAAVGYEYLEDGRRGVCELARFHEHFSIVTA